MKILKDVIIYQCEFCGKVSLSRGGLSNHERFYRVKHEYKDGSPCFGCKMLTMRKMFQSSLESLFGKICKENEELVNKSSTYPL